MRLMFIHVIGVLLMMEILCKGLAPLLLFQLNKVIIFSLILMSLCYFQSLTSFFLFLKYFCIFIAATTGRNGLGSVYVWAAGNGGKNNDNCNYDGYANSPFTIAGTHNCTTQPHTRDHTTIHSRLIFFSFCQLVRLTPTENTLLLGFSSFSLFLSFPLTPFFSFSEPCSAMLTTSPGGEDKDDTIVGITTTDSHDCSSDFTGFFFFLGSHFLNF